MRQHRGPDGVGRARVLAALWEVCEVRTAATVTELVELTGYARSTVHHHLDALIDIGAVTYTAVGTRAASRTFRPAAARPIRYAASPDRRGSRRRPVVPPRVAALP